MLRFLLSNVGTTHKRLPRSERSKRNREYDTGGTPARIDTGGMPAGSGSEETEKNGKNITEGDLFGFGFSGDRICPDVFVVFFVYYFT